MRIGSGWDLHRLAPGRKLILGGVVIPSEKGEVAHSDGDVLIHALIDAILGSCARGDIGSHFPPSDEKWKDADSRLLLKSVLEETAPSFCNIDCTIVLQEPKLRGHTRGTWKRGRSRGLRDNPRQLSQRQRQGAASAPCSFPLCPLSD